MPAPYSQDLRKKAVAVVTSGRAISAVSQAFRINRNTLSEWVTRYRATGDVLPKQGYQQGHSHKITDWDAFRAFAQEQGDKTQAEMAQRWPDEIREDTVGRELKRIGFTRKKDLCLSGTRPSETPSVPSRTGNDPTGTAGVSR